MEKQRVWIIGRDLSESDIKAVCLSEEVAWAIEGRLINAGLSVDVEECEVLGDESEVVPRAEYNVRVDEHGEVVERWRHVVWPYVEGLRQENVVVAPRSKRVRGVAAWAMSTQGHEEALRLARAALAAWQERSDNDRDNDKE